MNQRLERIMLIDDCEADNYLHRKIILDMAAADEVLVMPNAEEALEHIASNAQAGLPQPELIFLDINIPGMEGWDFVECFDKLDQSRKEGTVVVMLSGSLNPDDRARARSMPLIKEFRSKPLSRSVLGEIVSTHFA